MDPTNALMEKRLALAGALLVGGIALTGCTAGPEKPDVPAYTYEAAPGVDQLPRVSGFNLLAAPDAAGLLINGEITEAIKRDKTRKAEDKYTTLSNTNPGSDKSNGEMPAIATAPVLDIMMGSDGELRYKDYTPGAADEQDAQILRAVAATSSLLKPAMHSGDVTTVHIRINQQPSKKDLAEYGPGPEMEDHAQFIGRDSNDGGKPSIYYFMEPNGNTDTQTIATEVGHEAGHALKHQVSAEDNKDIVLTGEERKLFVEACGAIRKQALTQISHESGYIISDLEKMRDLSKPEFRDEYNKVINAIKNDEYWKLPNFEKPSGGVPECFIQHPFKAFLAQVPVADMRTRLKHQSEKNEEAFEAAGGDLVDEWNDLLKQGAIYKILSESTYLGRKDDDHYRWGHPYDNAYELGASATNISLMHPKDFGDNVSELDPNQRAIVIKFVKGNAESLKNSHRTETEFCKFVDAQVAIFLQSANIPK